MPNSAWKKKHPEIVVSFLLRKHVQPAPVPVTQASSLGEPGSKACGGFAADGFLGTCSSKLVTARVVAELLTCPLRRSGGSPLSRDLPKGLQEPKTADSLGREPGSAQESRPVRPLSDPTV